MTRVICIFIVGYLLNACSDSSDSSIDQDPRNPFQGFVSDIYSNSENWLCHPSLGDADNVCASNLDSTIVFPDGSNEIEPFTAATDPAVDCFYVYPTVSADEGGNSDLIKGPEEIFTALNQAARYSKFCRVFAPVYRQTTVSSIFTDAQGDRALAYSDVLNSFKHYMASYNNGRGFVLIGHSQGSGHLRRLIAETIETEDYLLQRLIAAHLLGSTIRTPEGADIGGDFQQVPVCRSADQTACIVSYATYRDTDPFLAAGEGRFGTPDDDEAAICSNPAALSGGNARLNSYFPIESTPLLEAVIIKRVEGPYADPDTAPPITTPFYIMPDFISGKCVVDENGISYLEAVVHADPNDPRADDFNGEFIGGDGWGLHLIDVTIAMGDLVELGATQARSWLQDQ